jgi:hypothetical protein
MIARKGKQSNAHHSRTGKLIMECCYSGKVNSNEQNKLQTATGLNLTNKTLKQRSQVDENT